jgi:hypothetical protein
MAGQGGWHAGIPAGTSPETVLYHAADVWITDTRVVLGGRSYQLQDIQSPEVAAVTPKQRFRARLPAIIPLALYTAFLLFGNFEDTFLAKLWPSISVIWLLALACASVFGVLRARKTRLATYYSVKLTGKEYAYTSTDGEYARWLAEQITRVKQGAGNVEAPPAQAAVDVGSGEYVFYSDGRATVTSKWYMLGSESTQLQDVKRASVTQVPSDKALQLQSLGSTLLFVNIFLTNIQNSAPNNGRDFYLLFPGDITLISFICFAVVLVLLFVVLTTLSGSAHVVTLHGNFEEARHKEVFASFDQAYAATLASHINNAISARKSGVLSGNAATPS